MFMFCYRHAPHVSTLILALFLLNLSITLKKLAQKFISPIFMKTTAFVHFLYEIYQIQCHMNHDFQKLYLLLFLKHIKYFILF